jgi:hypothetical protein
MAVNPQKPPRRAAAEHQPNIPLWIADAHMVRQKIYLKGVIIPQT